MPHAPLEEVVSQQKWLSHNDDEKNRVFFCLQITAVVFSTAILQGAQWLNGRVLDSRPKGRGFKPHRRHCVVSLSKNINPSLVLVQPRKTRRFITERLLMGCKESNQTKQDSHSLLEGLLSVTSKSICTKYWLTAWSSLLRKKVWFGERTVPT